MAKWSPIWKEFGSNGRAMSVGCSSKELVRQLVQAAAFIPPAKAKKRKGGEYPHLQPFFRNKVRPVTTPPKEMLEILEEVLA